MQEAGATKNTLSEAPQKAIALILKSTLDMNCSSTNLVHHIGLLLKQQLW